MLIYLHVPRSVAVDVHARENTLLVDICETHYLLIFVMLLSLLLKQNPFQGSAQGSLLKPVGLNALVFLYFI